MIENDEPSLQQQFVYCENIVEDLLHDRLGDSKSQQRNDKLKNCIERLQLVSRTVESLSLFSTNDQVEELPTTSLRYLLVPAYFAYVLQEINVEIGKRPVYLKSAKASYREFLQNLLTYGLINFKLPWINGDEDTTKIELKKESFEDLSAKRQQKISRLRQMEQLENTLEKLRIEERRDDDDAAKREVIFVLLRLWSIRAVKELDTIDDELRLLEQASSCVAEESTSNMSHVEQTAKFTPFILTRTEQQKKVFGLGYPSIPTVSVDEWFDEMKKTGGFGNIGSNKRQIIQSHNDEHSDEDDDETKRQSKIRMDEWKDINPRGWGNTLNKG
uniref:TAP42-like protein n=1 Tax=Meloidogyne incognita TaxID=6306 RepID=A0A914LSN6_MELIC